MSTRRTLATAGWVDVSAVTGCRWCDGPIVPPRRTFCSDACVNEHKIRSDPGYARARVFERDRGVCAMCRLDTDRLERIIAWYRRMCWGAWGRAVGVAGLEPWHTRGGGERYRIFRLLGLEVSRIGSRSSYWDMDHMTPVVEGGGECGLENLRTLCLWCHRRETTRLARRRARERSQQSTLFGADVLDADLEGA